MGKDRGNDHKLSKLIMTYYIQTERFSKENIS